MIGLHITTKPATNLWETKNCDTNCLSVHSVKERLSALDWMGQLTLINTHCSSSVINFPQSITVELHLHCFYTLVQNRLSRLSQEVEPQCWMNSSAECSQQQLQLCRNTICCLLCANNVTECGCNIYHDFKVELLPFFLFSPVTQSPWMVAEVKVATGMFFIEQTWSPWFHGGKRHS